MSDIHKQMLKSKLPPLKPPHEAGFRGRRRDYTPVAWDKYFDSYKDVQVSHDNTFRVYLKGTKGPVLILLHGGGYSGLTWSLLSVSLTNLVECRIAAMDIRGHGETRCSDDTDLSAETLSNDVGEVFTSLYSNEELPPIILIGHSMGGAIAVHTVYKELIPSAIALIVIDVVEGTALSALQSMQNFLRSRPPSFESLPVAIEWCVRSGQVRNVESAKVSMPGQLKNVFTDQCATRDIKSPTVDDGSASQASAPRHVAPTDCILEEADESEEDANKNNFPEQSAQLAGRSTDAFKIPQRKATPAPKYVWRIELSKTEKYWTGWFEGLSTMFLSIHVPKLLLLAGVDRLDKDLTIGQMQGKFQMHVLPQCGHAVHEDDPDKVAEAISTFMIRNKFATALCT